MNTIADKLTYLEDTKTAIGNAIVGKGGSITGKTFRQYATEISNLPSGGGTKIAVSKDVSEYTGGSSFNFLNQITSVNFPSGITSIADNAFYQCSGLTTITIPDSVTSIESYVFYGCSGLTTITIPDSVTFIGTSAFRQCTGLTTITIPSSVTSIGRNAFDSCSGLTSVTCEPTTPPTLRGGVFDNTNDCPIYVPAESVETYKAANNWSTYASRIQAIPNSN